MPRICLGVPAGSTTAALAITDLTNQIATNTALSAAGITVSGAAGGALTFTNARGEQFNVSATGDTSNVLGLGSFSKGSGPGNTVDYTTIQGAAYANTTQYGTDTRNQLARAERFGQVIIGAHFQADDTIDLLTASGKHDDGYAIQRPDPSQHFET